MRRTTKDKCCLVTFCLYSFAIVIIIGLGFFFGNYSNIGTFVSSNGPCNSSLQCIFGSIQMLVKIFRLVQQLVPLLMCSICRKYCSIDSGLRQSLLQSFSISKFSFANINIQSVLFLHSHALYKRWHPDRIDVPLYPPHLLAKTNIYLHLCDFSSPSGIFVLSTEVNQFTNSKSIDSSQHHLLPG